MTYTTRNNAALRRIKATFNSKIYDRARQHLNEGGTETLRTYLRTFFNDQYQHRADKIIDGTGTEQAS